MLFWYAKFFQNLCFNHLANNFSIYRNDEFLFAPIYNIMLETHVSKVSNGKTFENGVNIIVIICSLIMAVLQSPFAHCFKLFLKVIPATRLDIVLECHSGRKKIDKTCNIEVECGSSCRYIQDIPSTYLPTNQETKMIV